MPEQYKIPSRLYPQYVTFVQQNPFIKETYPGQTYMTAFLRQKRDQGKLTKNELKTLRKLLLSEAKNEVQTTL